METEEPKTERGNVLELSKSSRATCRVCNGSIQAGEVRFGRAYAGPHGEAHAWHHLRCAARNAPRELAVTLAAFPVEVPGLADAIAGTKVAESAL